MPIGASKIGTLGGQVPGGSQTFNSSGTFVVPVGVTKISVTGKGAPGNSGNPGNPGNPGNAGNLGNGAGGGGGGGAKADNRTCIAGSGGHGVNPGPDNPYNLPAANRYNPIGTGGNGTTSPNGTANPGNAAGSGLSGSAGSSGSAGNPGSAGNTGSASSAFNYNFAGGAGGAAGNAGTAGAAGNAGSGGSGGNAGNAGQNGNGNGGSGGNGGGSGGPGVTACFFPGCCCNFDTPYQVGNGGGGGGGAGATNPGASSPGPAGWPWPIPGSPFVNSGRVIFGGNTCDCPVLPTLARCPFNSFPLDPMASPPGNRSGGNGGTEAPGGGSFGNRTFYRFGASGPNPAVGPTLNLWRSGGGGGGGGGGSGTPNQPRGSGGGAGGGGRGNAGNAGGAGNSGGPGGAGSAANPSSQNCIPVTPGAPYPISVASPGGQVIINWNPQ